MTGDPSLFCRYEAIIGLGTRITAVLPHVFSRISLRFTGGVYSLFVVRLIGSLTGQEAVNGYQISYQYADYLHSACNRKWSAPGRECFPAHWTEFAP